VRIEVLRPTFCAPRITPTSAGIACALGVVREDLAPAPPSPPVVSIDARPGALSVVTGPSGSGKSSILRAVACASRRRGLVVVTQPSGSLGDRPVCDLFARDPGDAMRSLVMAGLGDVRAMVRPAHELSEGQRARVRIALALARGSRAAQRGGRVIVVLDEVGSNLDALTARGVAMMIHRAVRGTGGFACVAATPRTDIAEYLAPSEIVAVGSDGGAMTTVCSADRPKPVRFVVRCATRADYLRLAPMHYRPGRPATIDRVLGAFESETGELAGVVVVSRPVVFASWRDLAWPGRYTHGSVRSLARRINREIRCISRVIVDPRFRSMGVAERMVRSYLRRPITPCTESLAAMGTVTDAGGFFGRAGMRMYRVPPRGPDARMLDALDHAGIGRWRLADPRGLRSRLGTGARARLIEREARRWASATGRIAGWRDATVEELLREVARHAASTPVAFAHTRVRRTST